MQHPLFYPADTALSVPAVIGALAATPAGANRPWARRALAVAYAVTGRAAEADAVAAGLVAEGAGHATVGHGVRVRLAVEADSLALALDRLGAFAATVTESDTLATEGYASALALVVAWFPGMDPSMLPGGSGGRSAKNADDSGRPAGDALASDEAQASREVYADEVAVYPNPTATRGTVRVSVSEPASSATVSIYDALGRRVAVLHDGPLVPGPRDLSLDANAFAPGVYVVHVRVRPEGGAAWTEVRRITVAR